MKQILSDLTSRTNSRPISNVPDDIEACLVHVCSLIVSGLLHLLLSYSLHHDHPDRADQIDKIYSPKTIRIITTSKAVELYSLSSNEVS